MRTDGVVINANGSSVELDIVDTPGMATKIGFREFLAYGLEGEEAKRRAQGATGGAAGLGEPFVDKLGARRAGAMMGVGAVKGVEIGAGFAVARLTGSVNNDPLVPPGTAPVTNNAGGILGGISCGWPIVIRAAVKPIPSIARPQSTIDTDGKPATITVGGRHDRSAIPRIVPVLKAMVLLTLADFLLMQRRMGGR